MFTRLQRRPSKARSLLFVWCLGAGLLGLCATGGAQTVRDNIALLGRGLTELQPRLGLQAVRSPRRLPSGAVGSARLADALFEGLHFEQTFFFARQTLRQVELLLPDAGAEATSQGQTILMQSLRTELGPELASFGTVPAGLPDSASWVSGDADVMLFRSGRPGHPSLRLVIRQREVVNADEL